MNKIDYRIKIKDEIIELGYDISNKGTIYLIDVIEFICKSENYMFIMSDLENNIYTNIAKKYKSNKKTIKSDIVKATNNMCKFRCVYNNNKYSKLTPKSVIFQIVDQIKNI